MSRSLNGSLEKFGAMAAALALGGCFYSAYDDPSSQYIQRTQTITMEAGNAQEVNAATQVIDPWPRNAGKKNIRANGDRMVNAAERYRAKATGTAAPGGQGGSPVAGAAGNFSGTVPSSQSSPLNTPPITPN